MSRPAPWIVLGIHSSHTDVVFAGMAETREEAVAMGRERKTAAEPYERWSVFRFDRHIGQKIEAWLLREGLPRKEAVSVIRQLGGILHKCLDMHRYN